MWKLVVLSLAALVLALWSSNAESQAPAQGEVYVVTAGSRWRKHYTFIPPLVSRQSLAANELDPNSDAQRQDLGRFNREALISAAKREIFTPPPPQNWMSPDFADREWLLTRGGDFAPLYTVDPTPETYSAMLSADPFVEQIGFIAMRGKFFVKDPATVENLKLSIEYRGGFVAYLNGVEIARGHVPDGVLTYDTPAEDYPLSAYVDRNGQATYTAFSVPREKEPLDTTEPRWSERVRRQDIVNIDIGLLIEGVNVLAIQLHRTDYPVEVREFAHSFAPIGIHNISLSAATRPENVVASLAPPAGLRVWNEPLWGDVSIESFGDPVEPLYPIRIEAARNGLFSGMAVAGSTRPITGIRASAGALTQEEGVAVIEADRITIRYGAVNPSRAEGWVRWDSGLQPFRYDLLLSEPPGSVNVQTARPLGDWTQVVRAHNNLPPEPTPYASIPVIMTVDVPGDFPAGLYTGALNITVPGQGEVSVPVEMRVSEWSVPNRSDYKSVAFFTHDYDYIGERYGAAEWSEEHWRLIDTTLQLMAEIGNAGFYFTLGTKEENQLAGIVRTTQRQDGTLEHDFSRLERYLDIALKYHDRDRMQIIVLHIFRDINGLNVHDERTGQRGFVNIPRLGTAESEAFLTPLLHGIRDVLAERGLDHLIMIGSTYDPVPSPDIVAMFNNILPGTPWYRVSHYDITSFPAAFRDTNLTLRTGAVSRVPRHFGTGMFTRPSPPASWMNLWDPFWKGDPNYMRLHYNRVGTAWAMHVFPEPWRYRGFFENAVLRGYRGVGNLCVDAFPGQREIYRGVLQDRQIAFSGRTPGVHVATHDVLARGQNGPAHSIRSLNMLEGVQETEARIAVWMALTDQDNPMPAEFTERAEKLFEERTQAIRTWDTNIDRSYYQYLMRHSMEYGAIGWLDKNRELFDFAAEIERYMR